MRCFCFELGWNFILFGQSITTWYYRMRSNDGSKNLGENNHKLILKMQNAGRFVRSFLGAETGREVSELSILPLCAQQQHAQSHSHVSIQMKSKERRGMKNGEREGVEVDRGSGLKQSSRGSKSAWSNICQFYHQHEKIKLAASKSILSWNMKFVAMSSFIMNVLSRWQVAHVIREFYGSLLVTSLSPCSKQCMLFVSRSHRKHIGMRWFRFSLWK